MNKVKWTRTEKGTIELFVFEPNKDGVGSWKLYTSSKCFTPDCTIPGASRGLETFRTCLKNGYILLDIEGNEIE